MSKNETYVYTACPGWGDHEYCTIKTIVKDGKIVRTEKADYTGPEADQGFICQKGIASARNPYSPHRLLYPMKRVGARGEGKWQRISWEQALDEIAAKMIELREKYGPKSIVMWNMHGGTPPTMGLDNLLGMRFTEVLAAVDPSAGYGVDNGAIYSSFFDMGNSFAYTGYDPRLIPLAKYIIVWGANPVENQHRLARHLVKAQENGAKLVDIGLVFDGTAGKADWFIPVKPGSDTALALAMAHIIIKENLYQVDYLLKNTVAPFLVRMDTKQFLRDENNNYQAWDAGEGKPISVAPREKDIAAAAPALTGEYTVDGVACKPAFQLLVEHLEQYTPEWQEPITGVSVETVYKLTHEYASTKPALLMGVLGMRYQNQGEAHRAHVLLGLLTGDIGTFGGGVTSSLNPMTFPFGLNDHPIAYPEGRPVKTTFMRLMDWFEQVKSDQPWPMRALIKTGSNPLHNLPNRGRWVNDILPKMELIVDYDVWLTDTGELADYLLPDCMSFERLEIIYPASYSHIVLQEPAIEPIGEARAPTYLYTELAKRLGVGEFFDKTEEEWLELRLQSQDPSISSITPPLTMERLRKEKRIRAAVPDIPYNPAGLFGFLTPSGRIEFYAELLADMDEAFAKYRPPLEVMDEKKMEKYPYHFFSGRQRFFMQSMFTDDPWMVKLSGDEPAARMNPIDAVREGLKDGDMLECYNDRGKVRAIMRVDEAVPPGTVHVWFGWRQRQFEEGTYAELLLPLSSKETTDALANRWWDIIEQQGKGGNYYVGGESGLAGAWDCLWDCLCAIKKVERKNGGQS